MTAKDKSASEHKDASAPAERRPPLDILHEMLVQIAAHLGNPPRLEALLAELEEKM